MIGKILCVIFGHYQPYFGREFATATFHLDSEDVFFGISRCRRCSQLVIEQCEVKEKND